MSSSVHGEPEVDVEVWAVAAPVYGEYPIVGSDSTNVSVVSVEGR